MNKSEQIAEQILNALINVRTWGFIIFNVIAYNAYGNGIKDDTTAIQSAIDAASENGGGIVWFPGGRTYKLTRALSVPSNVTLYGDSSAILKWANGVAAPSKGAIQLIGTNSRVIGLTLDLNGKTTLNGIAVLNKGFVIDKVTIRNGYDYGIWVFEDIVAPATVPAGNDVAGEGFITNCDVSARDCYEIYSGRKVVISNCIARGDASRTSSPSQTGFLVWGRGRNVALQGCIALGSYLSGAFQFVGKEQSEATPRMINGNITMTNCQAIINGPGSGMLVVDCSYVNANSLYIEQTGTGHGIKLSQSDPIAGSTKSITIQGTVNTNSGTPVYVESVADVELSLTMQTVSAAQLAYIGGAGKRVKFRGGTFNLSSTLGADNFFAFTNNAFGSITFDGVTFKGSATGYNLRNAPFFGEYVKIVNCIFDGVRVNVMKPGSYVQVANCHFMDLDNVIPAGGNFWINCYEADKYSIIGNVAQITPTIANFVLFDSGTNRVVANNLFI
ncbi:glycosyl hydrolase family 28-related protein [Gorillibacterium sp. sgz5001074]|uniref:glycosyl hydrolase family 28-related protein n=1 Tax=Gorillibacterium sp. sgz5001074 TaxID=3446695 RepID=UPI003F6820B5